MISPVHSTGGYWIVSHKGKNLRAHRIVYALVHNVSLDKNMVIDHIDSNRSNNLISNLQQVSIRENNIKATLSRNNKSGAKGVSWHKRDNAWTASWMLNGKVKSKQFNPNTLYPDSEYDTAKQMAFDDAVEYRKKMIELHYGQSSQIGEIP